MGTAPAANCCPCKRSAGTTATVVQPTLAVSATRDTRVERSHCVERATTGARLVLVRKERRPILSSRLAKVVRFRSLVTFRFVEGSGPADRRSIDIDLFIVVAPSGRCRGRIGALDGTPGTGLRAVDRRTSARLEPLSKSFEERETFTPDSERRQTFERFVPAHFHSDTAGGDAHASLRHGGRRSWQGRPTVGRRSDGLPEASDQTDGIRWLSDITASWRGGSGSPLGSRLFYTESQLPSRLTETILRQVLVFSANRVNGADERRETSDVRRKPSTCQMEGPAGGRPRRDRGMLGRRGCHDAEIRTDARLGRCDPGESRGRRSAPAPSRTEPARPPVRCPDVPRAP